MGKIPHKKINGARDLVIKSPADVQKKESHELPSDEVLYKQFEQKVECEACLYSEQCYGFCLYI